MITDDKKFLIGGALLQIILLGVLVAILHPHVTMASLLCLLLLLAAEVVIYREVRGMKEPAQAQRPRRDLAGLKRRPGSDPAHRP